MEKALNGKIAVVTGASSGIGKASAIALAGEGAVVVLASRNFAELEKMSKSLNKKNPNSAFAFKCDLTDKKQIEMLSNFVLKKFGKIDILLNNAGIAFWKKFNEMPLDEIEKTISLNLMGTIYCTKAFLPQFLEQKSGTIINISSGLGKRGATGAVAYCASKFGVVGFSESLYWELKDFGINVSCVLPGKVDTALFDLPKNSPERKKMLSAEKVAELIVFLCKQPPFTNIKEISIRSGKQ